MNSGGLVGILYDISAACVQTGVYNVFFQIPYDVTNSEGTESKLVTYTMILACPQELNVWMFNPDDDSLSARQTLLFENGKYIQKP
jgi:hypothetical protein